MSETGSPNNNRSPFDFLYDLITNIPPRFRPIISLLLLFLIIGGGLYYFLVKPNSESKDEDNRVTIIGQLIETNSRKPVSDVIVELSSNSTISHFSEHDGTFILDGIELPKSKIISINIFHKGTLKGSKSFNLNNDRKYEVSSNNIIDLGEVYLPTINDEAIKVPSEPTVIINKEEDSNKIKSGNQNPKYQNNHIGTIIEDVGDSASIEISNNFSTPINAQNK